MTKIRMLYYFLLCLSIAYADRSWGQVPSSCVKLDSLYFLCSNSDFADITTDLAIMDTCYNEINLGWYRSVGPLEVVKQGNSFKIRGFIYRLDLNGQLKMIKVLNCVYDMAKSPDKIIKSPRLDVASYVDSLAVAADLKSMDTYLTNFPDEIGKREEVIISSLLFDLMLLGIADDANAVQQFVALSERLKNKIASHQTIHESLMECAMILFDNGKITLAEFKSIQQNN